MKKKISAADRRHQDYLRRKGLRVGHDYELKLVRLRNAEAKRLLTLCAENYSDRQSWEAVISEHLDESYLAPWFRRLYVATGLPQAASVTRDLSRGKADKPSSEWEKAIIRYADERIGSEIVTLSGTFKDAMIGILRRHLSEDVDVGVEAFTQRILKDFKGEYAEWMARRIAQTETMISLGEAGAVAARTLDVGFVKQWCISGVGNTRDTHEVMDGVVVGQDEPFELEDCTMLYPHDTSTGAPAGEIINCACSVIRIPT